MAGKKEQQNFFRRYQKMRRPIVTVLVRTVLPAFLCLVPLALLSCSQNTPAGSGSAAMSSIAPISPADDGLAAETPGSSTRREDASPQLIGREEPRPLAPVVPGPGTMSAELTSTTAATTALPELKDGDNIVNRTGRMVRQGRTDRWQFVFSPQVEGRPPLPPMEILPSPYLAEMEKIVATPETEEEVVFQITAEVTRYRENAYLMIRKALVERTVHR